MILDRLLVEPAEIEHRTGWSVQPQGICKGERCIPFSAEPDGRLDITRLADRLGMPLVHDEGSGLWALGPESGGPALASSTAPDLELPDVHGNPFALRSLHGSKVLLLAWASW
jgi:hypothetical protein